jgi:uncharacterized protein (DUF1015 family)
MADVQPFRALHYADADAQDVVAPPYDVIDAEQREALKARSPHNIVEIDLPVDYDTAARVFTEWRDDGVLVRDDQPAFWVLVQDYTGPDGNAYTRTGFFGRVKVEEYGAGRVRPHERTHPGPKEDRLRLTRATKANLSPIFVLFDAEVDLSVSGEPFADVTDDDGTRHRLYRIDDPDRLAAIHAALEPSELLIADGHHRYETARVYAEEIGGDGPHRYVMACLVSLSDPGLTVFPTHRLLTDLNDSERQEALRDTLIRDWNIVPIEIDELEPAPDGETVALGYMDNFHQQAYRLTLKNEQIARDALPGMSPAYQRLDTAVLEALLLKGPLQMTEDDISHFNGLDYSRTFSEARDKITSKEVSAGFFTGPVPVSQIRDIAGAGEVMPPKSTFFFPKVLTGLLINTLDEE